MAPRITLILPGKTPPQARTRVARTRAASEQRRSRRLQRIPLENFELPPPRRAHSEAPRTPIHFNMVDTQAIIDALTFSRTNRVCKLDSKNYIRWKRNMKLRLQSGNLWDVVTTPTPDAANEARLVKEAKALTDINDYCELYQQDLIADCTTPKEACDLLKATYEPKTAANTNRLWREFESCQKNSQESVMEYYGRVKTTARNIKAVGESVPNSRLLEKLIMGLGLEFELVKSNFNLRTDLTE